MDKLEYIPGDLVYFETEKAKVEFCNPSTDGSVWVRVIPQFGIKIVPKKVGNLRYFLYLCS